MEQVQLAVQVRMQVGKNIGKKLLREGKIPAVVYGSDGESLPIAVNVRELQRALTTPAGVNAIVELGIDGDAGEDRITSMIKELQFEPVSRELIHVDFKQVNLSQPIQVEVPVHLVGEATGTASGGIVQQQMRTINVECLPNDIPERIDVDITDLDVGDSLTVSRLPFYPLVKVVDDKDQVIISILAPTVQEEVVSEPVDEEGQAPETPEVEQQKDEE